MKCKEYSKIWLNLIFAALNLTFIRGQKAFPVFNADRVIIRLPCGQGQLSRIWKVQCDWLSLGKECCLRLSRRLWEGMKKRAPLKTPAWEATTKCNCSSKIHFILIIVVVALLLLLRTFLPEFYFSRGSFTILELACSTRRDSRVRWIEKAQTLGLRFQTSVLNDEPLKSFKEWMLTVGIRIRCLPPRKPMGSTQFNI